MRRIGRLVINAANEAREAALVTTFLFSVIVLIFVGSIALNVFLDAVTGVFR